MKTPESMTDYLKLTVAQKLELAGLPSVPKRLELRLVNYEDGDRLVRDGWTIAPEEDNNHAFGMVYLERLEAVSESARRLKRKENDHAD